MVVVMLHMQPNALFSVYYSWNFTAQMYHMMSYVYSTKYFQYFSMEVDKFHLIFEVGCASLNHII